MTDDQLAQGADERDPLVERLRDMLADLEGYVDRRAKEVAAPVIAQAEEAAAERVREARRETRREEDLVAELRRVMRIRDRQEAAQARAVLRLAEHLSEEARADFLVSHDVGLAARVVEQYERDHPEAPPHRGRPTPP